MWKSEGRTRTACVCCEGRVAAGALLSGGIIGVARLAVQARGDHRLAVGIQPVSARADASSEAALSIALAVAHSRARVAANDQRVGLVPICLRVGERRVGRTVVLVKPLVARRVERLRLGRVWLKARQRAPIRVRSEPASVLAPHRLEAGLLGVAIVGVHALAPRTAVRVARPPPRDAPPAATKGAAREDEADESGQREPDGWAKRGRSTDAANPRPGEQEEDNVENLAGDERECLSRDSLCVAQDGQGRCSQRR